MLGAIGGLVGGLAGGIGSIIDTVNARKTAQENLQFQREQLAATQRNQQIQWAREDNAVSRRAIDLKNAGLSKTLAAGSAAQASAPIRLDAPQKEHVPISPAIGASLSAAEKAMALFRMKNDITLSELEKQRVQEQIKQARADTRMKNVMADQTEHDNEIYKKYPFMLRTGSPYGRDIVSGFGANLELFNKVKDYVESRGENIKDALRKLVSWKEFFKSKKTK